MNMNKSRILIAAVSMFAVLSCATTPTAGLNDDAYANFEAWISQNHPTAVKTPLGAYIIEENPGTGIPAGDSLYLRINYTCYTLEGDIESTTYAKLAKQTGSFNKVSWYGPTLAYRGEDLDNLAAGLEESVAGMKVGGHKLVAIPGWLSKSERYSSPEKYLQKCSGTNYIYDITLVDAFGDAQKWETDSLARYIAAEYPAAVSDTAGFWFLSEFTPAEAAGIEEDAKVKINYTGRRLDGRVFDTTIADTAKVWGIYSSSKTYEPQTINWYGVDEDYTKITMGTDASSLVTGFSYGLSKMHKGEKARFFFYSGYGYGTSGSGNAIPAYSPLCFELEILED